MKDRLYLEFLSVYKWKSESELHLYFTEMAAYPIYIQFI